MFYSCLDFLWAFYLKDGVFKALFQYFLRMSLPKKHGFFIFNKRTYIGRLKFSHFAVLS